ncbi:Rne/Rng family ribonuclease [Pseudorhodoplanes sinuspersici]|uniref:Ribonuclease E n=1 Tax=Pseudorhodoplanes sinuspersici TaxID=1235591 RepID=A0A1W6ZXA3_9HYPH|nr:ribonuclease E/G [Pseudorhodoplanes sinuspersici]ARQ02012.1 ribonuclease [Pseudorhodoplanes sinuspersici]RKE73794.1 RNAse E [Pseudorhodoplanes sinuspersici]
MSNKMLIDATHPEETRVVVLRGNRVEEFDFESASRKQLRGNIYLAKVTRVEPSLQAAFVDYGGNRHGFLAFSEIHPDYYQIPVADRQALLEDERRSHTDDEDDNGGAQSKGERRGGRRGRHSRRGSNRNRNRDVVRSDVIEGQTETPVIDKEAPHHSFEGDAPEQVLNDNGDQFTQQEYSREAGETVAEATSGEPQPQDVTPQVSEEPVTPQTSEQPEAKEPSSEASEASVAPEASPASAAAVEYDAGVPVESVSAAYDNDDADNDNADKTAEDAPGIAADASTDDEHGADDHASDDRSTDHEDRSTDHNGDDENDDDDGEESEESDEEEVVESVGGDAIEEVMERAPRYRRHYKIQEVIKRRQVMLVQVVKEERGTKGAALTTYLSLAGRYSVLMPNTARGGGISRKVTNAEDRKHMKEIAEALEVPEGMGVILRTAGAARTKIEIKRDFEYLLRLWETVRDLTLKSTAPTLVYEEGSLVKRAIRDLYHKDIEEIVVEGEAAYREAKDFMRMLMPSAVKSVVPYSDAQPIFTRYGIESQLDAMFQPTVQLKSGGYIVINQTEALVAIDVNSGRATREHSIEDTATKTNSEAAVEIARQLRLRDLAGLIVIDFIDMDEGRNNRSVERKLKDALKSDRARIQVGRISHFGLMEMSRQRIRSSVLESSTETCPHCGGTGHVRAVSSVALQLVRGVEETLLKGATHNLIVRSRSDVAIYVLNHKRAHLRMLEERFKITIAVTVDPTLTGHPSFAIDRGEQVMSMDQAKAIAATIKPDSIPVYAEDEDIEVVEDEVLDELEAEGEETAEAQEQQEPTGRRKRRRGRRGRGRDGEGREQAEASAVPSEGDEIAAGEAVSSDGEAAAEDATASADGDSEGDRRRRRRGRRGGRRNRRDRDGQPDDATGDEASGEDVARDDIAAKHDEPVDKEAVQDAVLAIENTGSSPQDEPQPLIAETPAAEPAPASQAFEAPQAPAEREQPVVRRRSTVREAPPVYSSNGEAAPTYAPPAPPPTSAPVESAEPAAETATQEKPRRFGWWSKRI